MYQRLLNSLCLFMLCSATAWGLPWFQPGPNYHRVSEKQRHLKKDEMNFSGYWQGECNHQPVEDLIIKHRPDRIMLKYGFMEETYVIGELSSNAASIHGQSDSGSRSATWNKAGDTLIFFNTQHFANLESHINIFFSKVAMTLSTGNLIIDGTYYQSSSESGDVTRETLICSYHQK